MAELQRRYDKVKRTLPVKVAAKAKNSFQDSFRRQGFLGSAGLESWPARKVEEGSKGRSILVKTGLLRRSLNTRITADTAAVYVSGPAKKYAAVHNNGGTINNKGGQPYIVLPADKVSTATRRRMPRRGDKVIVFLRKNRPFMPKNVRYTKPFSFTMPQRKFIGQSNVLNRQLLVMIHKELRSITN